MRYNGRMGRTPGSVNSAYRTVDAVAFQGVTYRRYPDAPRRRDRVYFTATGGQTLHRAIWEAHHGPVPEGCHVHHKDQDPLNNDISNLQCMSSSPHLALHSRQSGKIAVESGHLDRIRDLTKEWHGSEEGRAWHSEHGREIWQKKEPTRHVCEQCGAAFEVTSVQQTGIRFCSNNCKSQWRRDSGVDDETRQCVKCGGDYRVNRYSYRRYCSKACRPPNRQARKNA